MYITDGQVHTEWYQRFEEGYRRRMGIIVMRQNEALVVGQLLVVVEVAEEV